MDVDVGRQTKTQTYISCLRNNFYYSRLLWHTMVPIKNEEGIEVKQTMNNRVVRVRIYGFLIRELNSAGLSSLRMFPR
jgi:hypothetical protein